MRKRYTPRYDAHAAKQLEYEREYLKHISAHYDIEVRKREYFAWTPKRMDSGAIVWFNNYIIYQKYYDVHGKIKILHENIYSQDEYVEMKLQGKVD